MNPAGVWVPDVKGYAGLAVPDDVRELGVKCGRFLQFKAIVLVVLRI